MRKRKNYWKLFITAFVWLASCLDAPPKQRKRTKEDILTDWLARMASNLVVYSFGN